MTSDPEAQAQGNLLAPSPVPLSLTDHWTPERIRALRKSLGFSQERFAARLGVHRCTVGHWEIGRFAPQAHHLRALDGLAPKRPDTTALQVSLTRLADAFGFAVSVPPKATAEHLVSELARLTSLRTRLYGQVSR